jgi:cell division protein FtsN
MHGVFDQEEFQPLDRRRDAELTLGPFKLLALFVGLVLLCGLCFGLGYSMGSHSVKNSAVEVQTPAAAPPAQTAVVHSSKPSANPQNAPQRAVVNLEPPASSGNQVVVPTSPPALPAANPGQGTVKPALPSQSSGARPSPQPAASASLALMVQIAAVSHQEDAQVLVGALRKRGYAVSVHHDPTDGLLHVQIGPFANRSEAGAMRQKLLNDGYNAIVQP